MRYTVYILLFIFFAYNSHAQIKKFPNGIYLNAEQLKNATPEFDADLHVVQRTSGGKMLVGGNDYKLESDVDSLNRKYIRKTIFAYVRKDSIFLNCLDYKLGGGYALTLTKGNFLAFRSELTDSKAVPLAVFGGAVGGAIAGSSQSLYVLSLRTGNVRLLSKEYLIERLKENQMLLDQYNKIPKKQKEAEEILLKYISSLNEEIKN